MKEPLRYFNANGCFGDGSRPTPYFRSASEILAHMDRLGIEKSLVWHTTAKNFHTIWGNQRLLEEIKKSGDGTRLIPAFTVSPEMFYESGAVEGLKKEMLDNRARALRIFPGALNHSLCQIETVVQAVRELKPILFFDCCDFFNLEELLCFARDHPDVPMVITQVIWVHLMPVLDLMRCCENVYMDTSFLVTPNGIEMIVREFGAGRLLFGMGFQSNNGASLAALHYADISEDEREMIAHINLKALLGLESAEPVYQDVTEKNSGSLWHNFLHEPTVGLDIIDAHGHLGPCNTNIMLGGNIVEQIKALLPVMNRFGVTTMIVSGMQALLTDSVEGNRVLENSVRAYPERFLGYLSYNPHYEKELLPLIDDFFSRDFFVGFKLHCDYWAVPVTDPRFIPVWEYADRHRLPILLHTWESDYNSPAILSGIVPRYPNAVFILGHSGGGDVGRREAEVLAGAHENVFLEFCGSYTSAIPYEETIQRVGVQKVLFGTDALFHNPIWEIGRALSMDISIEDLKFMMAGTMRKILSKRR